MLTILAVSVVGIANVSGCVLTQRKAPELYLPDRPVLQELSNDEWGSVPAPVREKLSDNLELIYLHVDRLEGVITRYNEWREGER